MTVYVDLLFGLNTIINYLLLRGSAAIGGCPVKLWRLLGAAALGGCYAVAVVLPGMQGLQLQIFQLLCVAAMMIFAFGWKRNTVRQGLFFLALSAAFGGMVLLAMQLVEPDFLLLEGRAYYAISTPALLLLAGLCYGLSALVLRGWGAHTGGDLVELELELNGRKTALKALRDTGNTLLDPVSGQQVLVAGRQVLTRLLPTNQPYAEDPAELLRQLSEQYPTLRFRLVPYEAVGVTGGLLPAVRCQGCLGGKRRAILVAFSNTELSPHGRFEALMGGVIT